MPRKVQFAVQIIAVYGHHYTHISNNISGSCYIISRTDRPNMSGVVEKRFFAYAKTKAQISFAVTAKLISAFVFTTRIAQSLSFLNPKFQASNHLVWLYSPIGVGPGRKPRRPVFSQRGSYSLHIKHWVTYSNINPNK